MLLNPDNRVFVGRRLDTPDAWQMPQGGIGRGEDPVAAARRELREEIGTDSAEVLAEMPHWLTYELPDHLVGRVWQGRFRGQRQKWIACRFTGRDADIDLGTAHPEFDAWRWVDPDRLIDLIVPFKRDVYAQVVKSFRYLWIPDTP